MDCSKCNKTIDKLKNFKDFSGAIIKKLNGEIVYILCHSCCNKIVKKNLFKMNK